MRSNAEQTSEHMRWFTGVPIGTNPLILLDMGISSVILWSLAVVLVILLQAFFGKSMSGAYIRSAVLFANYLVAFVVGAFLIVAFLLFPNHYVVLYRFDPEYAYSESMKGKRFSLRESMHWRPFQVNAIEKFKRNVTKKVQWSDVRCFQTMDTMHVIFLKGTKGTLMRIYCPDEHVYRQAVAYIQQREIKEIKK
ncbi:hypothetical protein RBH88_00445 [Aminobacterium sp. MB27-C1]|uniref:hypothetical protein n=1 Tax=unclassified Aminobacterium TaxID=2685012 RepID=UPI0027DE2CDD|nr:MULTISPECIES: hypothetical protein [unclassified Aminobacterium]MEA4877984.1 hypothetical protein [Aminobacterium sp.]WMI71585.1 hypothetical protein RBH88_00445 [Aminobacterium sp. MB27-C1]